MKLADLLKPWITQGINECTVLSIEHDSRRIQPGALFLAYPGAEKDGRLFIDRAVSAGAGAIAYEPFNFPQDSFLPLSIPCIPVPNLAREAGFIAQKFYNNSGCSLSVTGVTGTNGKTTIAYQLAQAYALLGQRAAYIGTIGQGDVHHALKPLDNTTPGALYLQKLFHDYKHQGIKQVCMEVSSHALAQHRVDAIEFNQAVFTNLTLDHLDYHRDMQNYAAAKALLFSRESLEWAILNQDDPYQTMMRAVIKPHVKQLTYGMQSSAEVQALKFSMGIHGTEIAVRSPWGTDQLKVKALGAFNVYNSLAVFSSLLAAGYASKEIINIMAELKPAPGRMQVVADSPYVVVDYAHTPDALKNVLITLNQLKKGRLWVVFGCGGDRDKTKRPLMGKVAADLADQVVVTSDNPRTEDPQMIINDIVKALSLSPAIQQIIRREEAIAYALNRAQEQDIILIAGKGHEAYQQIGLAKHVFSDQEVVQRILQTKGLI